MVILNFEVDEVELAENLESDLSKTDFDLFVITIFIMPVRLNINGVEFFRYNSPDPLEYWAGMPIMNIASNGLIHVKELPLNGMEAYDLPEGCGVLFFQMLPENKVSIKFRERIHVVVPYEELLKAFEDFAASVRKFLYERAPEMDKHPYWGPWLRGERD